MLDIVITHYTEPWEVCRRLFETLDAQRGVDWSEIRVTIVNDGGFRLPEDKLYALNIVPQQIDIPHGGVSAARNAGLDHATEPWIMFCDCDDCFSNVFALEDILNVLRPPAEEQFDMMWTKVWGEEETDGKHRAYMIQNIKIMVFIHGKVYRREFLKANGIRFDEGLTFNEDSAFNAEVLNRTRAERVGAINTFAPAYVWIRREGSVTSAEDVNDRAAMGQVKRNLKISEDTRITRPEQYAGMITRTVYDVYFILHSRRCTEKTKQQIRLVFALSAYGWEKVFGAVDMQTMRKIRQISRAELTEPDEQIPDDPDTVRGWMLEVMQT